MKEIKKIDNTVALRREIHQYPELSGQEKKTNALVQRELNRLGIEFKSGYSTYGIVARIKGLRPTSRTVALRADMDALAVTEDTGLPYTSKQKGVMHACGHDVHTAVLLGAAELLQLSHSKWEGTVLLVFQPSEEKYGGGADVMLKEKALNAFGSRLPERMYALHVAPELAAGTFGFKEGQYMASTDEIYITVSGKGGHAALPKETTNTVLAAAKILVELQKIVSHKKNAILAFGRVIADGQTNVIPDSVEIAGTLRTFDEKFRKEAHIEIARTAKTVALSLGAKAEVRIAHGYPVLLNDAGATQRARTLAEKLVGKSRVKDLDLRTTSEDFAFFAQKIPSCFFRLGTGKSKGGLHSPHFTIDERAIATGVKIMTLLGMGG
ncbi:MAG: amidohydrolase [Bacteroidales bacterium]|jgi:amidohydrolase|nr:amidohydrolase [Bacteroidales bacterium]